jgi:hypothetical protein
MGAELDLENRRLCPDGACIGVIGADGRCRVCGRVDDGAPQTPETPLTQLRMDSVAEDDESEDIVATAEGETDFVEDADDDRRLCPDEACVGLVGPDGKCKICGLPPSS